ncbi:MAG: L,D-transpeptidase [Verrucomicrobiae bacterium]|nr:L,D-transpeptidase [Verrucomicrobiae bacterium]
MKSSRSSRRRALSPFLVSAVAAISISSCATRPSAEFDSVASPPTNPRNVRVRVSLQNRAVYVMEGNRPLLVTPVAIGKPGNETPTGNFVAFNKIARKRSNTYGFHVRGGDVRPGTHANTPSGSRYVGYPMPCWVEFSPGYGFHAGSVWPTPRTHGCLRLHPNVAPKFFSIVPKGTPILIARSLPEDATLGKNLARPTDYADPDPPASYMTTDAAFQDLLGKSLRR